MENNTPNVYRFTGLIAVLGLLTLVVGLVVMLLMPSIRFASLGILALGVALLAVAFIIDFRRVSSALAGRRGRFSTGTTVMASVFIGIILVTNAISVGNYQRFDTTVLGEFTLTEQTKGVLQDLKTPVKVTGFFVPGDPIGDSINDLLAEYTYYTNQLSVSFVDPDEHPDQAKKYGITQYETIVFESQDRHRLVLPYEIIMLAEDGTPVGIDAEHAFTSSILEVTGTVQKKVYLLTGHGEVNLNSTASNGYAYVKRGLLDDLYLMDTLDLLTSPNIPTDCAALIIASPRKALSSNEIDIIDHYLKKGGQALILTDPNYPAGIQEIVSPWNVVLQDGTVIDPTSNIAPKKDIPSVTSDRDTFGLPVAYFPGAIAVTPKEGTASSADATNEMLPLVWASKESWLEKDFDAKTEPVFNQDRDIAGPISMGVLVAAAPTEGSDTNKLVRLVVIGDSDFATNEHFYNGNNSDLFLNSVSWLTEETQLITIRRKVLPFRRLTATPEEMQFINYTSLGLLPLIVLVAGGIIWWQRR